MQDEAPHTMGAGVRSTGKRSRSRSRGRCGSVPEPTAEVARHEWLEEALMQQMEMQKQLHQQLEVRCVLHRDNEE